MYLENMPETSDNRVKNGRLDFLKWVGRGLVPGFKTRRLFQLDALQENGQEINWNKEASKTVFWGLLGVVIETLIAVSLLPEKHQTAVAVAGITVLLAATFNFIDTATSAAAMNNRGHQRNPT